MLRINKIRNYILQHKELLGILPALLIVLCFFVGGFLQSLLISLDNQEGINGGNGNGWAYKELWNLSFLQSLGVTVGMAAAASLFSGILGLCIALLLATFTYKRTWAHLIFQLPFGVPHLLTAYMLSQVFMQSGWYSRIAYHIGWIDSFEAFPVLIHDSWGIGVLLAYSWKEIPFIVLLIYPFVTRLILEWKDTVHMLGASYLQMIHWVIVPILVPLWIGGMWVIFAFALGAYEIPALLARTSFGFIPVLAWQEYTQFGYERQSLAVAMNVVLAVVSLIIGIFLLLLQKKWYKKGRRAWKS